LFKAAGIAEDAIRAFGQLRKFKPKSAIQFINKILEKNPGLRVQLLGDEYADIKNYYAALNTTMTDAGIKLDFSMPKQKEPGVPSEAISAATLPLIKHLKPILSGIGKLAAGIDLPPIQAAFALADPTTLAYTLPFSNLAAKQSGMYKPAKTKIGEWAKTFARGMPRKFAKNVLPAVSRASIPFSAAYGVHAAFKASKPDYYIDPKTGDPTFYKREKAADVMPTFIDIYEQASQIAQDQGISYKEALNKVNFERFYRLNEKEGGIASLKK
jgi:hypothetical protein